MKHPLLIEIKEKTRDQHEKIEKNPFAMSIMNGSVSLEQYTIYLKKFYGFHAAIEPLFESNLSGIPELDIFKRKKLQLIENDLIALGLDKASISQIPHCSQLPQLDSIATALGSMYVLEGSTLGGQIVSKKLKNSVGEDIPTSYFNSYGKETGPMWTKFCNVLTNSLSENDSSSTVHAARDTFSKLDEWIYSEKG